LGIQPFGDNFDFSKFDRCLHSHHNFAQRFSLFPRFDLLPPVFPIAVLQPENHFGGMLLRDRSFTVSS